MSVAYRCSFCGANLNSAGQCPNRCDDRHYGPSDAEQRWPAQAVNLPPPMESEQRKHEFVSDEFPELGADPKRPTEKEQPTPRTDACIEQRKLLLAKYGTRDGVGEEFDKGNLWKLARQLERELAEAQRDLAVLSAVLPHDEAAQSASGTLPGLTPSDGLEKELYEAASKAIQGWCDGEPVPLVQIVDDHMQAIMDALAVLASRSEREGK